MPETTTQVIVHSQPVTIELQTAKDGTRYGTVTVHAATVAEAIAMQKEAEEQLRAQFHYGITIVKASTPPAGS